MQPTRSYICTQSRELDVKVPSTIVDSPTRRKRPRPQGPKVSAATLVFDDDGREEVVREHVPSSRGARLLASKTRRSSEGAARFGIVNTLARDEALASERNRSAAAEGG